MLNSIGVFSAAPGRSSFPGGERSCCQHRIVIPPVSGDFLSEPFRSAERLGFVFQFDFCHREPEIFPEEFVDFTGGITFRNKWLHLENPTDREIELIERMTGVDSDMLKAALDEEERARIETDENDTLFLFDIPTIEEEENYYSYSTMPLGVILNDCCIITVCLKENSIISNFINNRIKKLDTTCRTNFLYQLLYHTHVKFLQYLRQIDRSSQRIQTELHRATKNKELIQLLDLENSLVYFSTSLRANALIIEKINRMRPPKNEDDEALLEDVGIENRQALDMCNIYRDILSGMMDAYASRAWVMASIPVAEVKPRGMLIMKSASTMAIFGSSS